MAKQIKTWYCDLETEVSEHFDKALQAAAKRPRVSEPDSNTLTPSSAAMDTTCAERSCPDPPSHSPSASSTMPPPSHPPSDLTRMPPHLSTPLPSLFPPPPPDQPTPTMVYPEYYYYTEEVDPLIDDHSVETPTTSPTLIGMEGSRVDIQPLPDGYLKFSAPPLSVTSPSDCTSPLSPICSPVWLDSHSSDESQALVHENRDAFTAHQDLYDTGMGEHQPVSSIQTKGTRSSFEALTKHRLFQPPVTSERRFQCQPYLPGSYNTQCYDERLRAWPLHNHTQQSSSAKLFQQAPSHHDPFTCDSHHDTLGCDLFHPTLTHKPYSSLTLPTSSESQQTSSDPSSFDQSSPTLFTDQYHSSSHQHTAHHPLSSDTQTDVSYDVRHRNLSLDFTFYSLTPSDSPDEGDDIENISLDWTEEEKNELGVITV